MKTGKLNIYKVIIQCVIALSILVLMAVYFNKSDNQLSSTGDTVLFIIAGVLAVATLVYVLYKNRQKAQKLKILLPEYLDVYDQVMAHVELSNINVFDKKNIASDVLSLLYEGQLRKDSVEEILGDDVKSFALSVTRALGGKVNWLIHEISGLQYFLGYLLLIKAADNMDSMKGLSSYLNATVDNSSILLFAVVSFIVIPLIFTLHQKTVFKESLMGLMSIYIAIPVGAVLLFRVMMGALKNNLMHVTFVEQLVDGKWTIFSSSVVLLMLLVIIATGFVVKRKIRYNQIKNI